MASSFLRVSLQDVRRVVFACRHGRNNDASWRAPRPLNQGMCLRVWGLGLRNIPGVLEASILCLKVYSWIREYGALSVISREPALYLHEGSTVTTVALQVVGRTAATALRFLSLWPRSWQSQNSKAAALFHDVAAKTPKTLIVVWVIQQQNSW